MSCWQIVSPRRGGPDNSRVPPDKSEVSVKANFSLAVFEYRLFRQRGSGPRLWKSHAESLCGGRSFTNHRFGLNINHDFYANIPSPRDARAPN
jgi:hypothetical protein